MRKIRRRGLLIAMKGHTTMHLDEKTLESCLVYDGKIVKLYRDKALLENNSEVIREVIKHPGGVCVVPLTDKNEVIMVTQLRYPHHKVLTEIPAGKLEWGEDHFECGKRELKEETGCTAEKYDYLGCLLPTPAYDTEVIHMYLARELSQAEQKLDEDEFLDVKKIPFEKAVEMVMNGEITDAKTQLALLKTKLLLEREMLTK